MSLEGWLKQSVKDICDLGRGRVISTQEIELHTGIYPVFSSQSQDKGEMGKIDTYDFEGEYITWTTDGAYAGTVFYRTGKFNCTNVCGTLKAKNRQLSMKFLAYKLSSLTKNYVSYVGNPKLMNNVMANIELSLPESQAEQTQIATILSTIDRAIEQTEALITKQQRIKTGLMQDLLTKGIDENGNIRSEETHEFKDSPLGRIPVEWEVEKLSSVVDLQVGYAFKSSWFSDNGLPLLRGENVGYGIPDWGDTQHLPDSLAVNFKDYVLSAGDVIIGMDRTFTKQGFKVSELSGNDVPSLLVQRVGRFITKQIPYQYMKLLIQSSNYQNTLLAQQQGMDIPHLSKSEILSPLVPIPSKQSEMENISEKTTSLNESIQNGIKYLQKLRFTKTGLMQDLLTGKVRVTDLLNQNTATN
jgi:type I restriction enzyme S subunit